MNLPELLAAAQPVDLLTRRIADDPLAGMHASARRGRGTDFDELREYTPGDDVRDIDWKVTSRMGRPFVRRHREEREMGVVLVVDVSASNAFGSGQHSKREFMALVGATLALSAARRGAKVGLFLFTDRVECRLAPRKGRPHALRLVRELLEFQPQGWGTDIAAALVALDHSLRRRSLVFLLSDFLPDASGADSAESRHRLAEMLGHTRLRHDLVCLQIHDPREGELPDVGLLTLEDGESSEIVEVLTTSGAVRERYAERQFRRLAELDLAFARAGIDHLRLATDQPCAPALRQFFATRHRRRSP